MKSKPSCFTIKSAETGGLLCSCASPSHFNRQHFCYLISPRRCGHVHIIKLLRPLTSTRPSPLFPLIALPPSSPEIIRVLQMKSQSHKSGTFPPPPHRFVHPLSFFASLIPPSRVCLRWTNCGSVSPDGEKKTKRKEKQKRYGQKGKRDKSLWGGVGGGAE